MNRYKAGGPSKATATTLCQKCLKRGHFSYECTASQQDRPYISRPSRTQQLLNPKLAPKLANTAPAAEAPKTSASDIIKSSAAARGREPSFDDLDEPRRRSPSVSSRSSSDSVSSISTNRSRSRSPPPRQTHKSSRSHRHEASERRRNRSRSADHHRSSLKRDDGKRKDSDRDGRSARSRSPARRHRRRSPSTERPKRPDRQRSRSRSPYRRPNESYERERPSSHADRAPPSPRERSLSPFSKRQALTRAQNGGGR